MITEQEGRRQGFAWLTETHVNVFRALRLGSVPLLWQPLGGSKLLPVSRENACVEQVGDRRTGIKRGDERGRIDMDGRPRCSTAFNSFLSF